MKKNKINFVKLALNKEIITNFQTGNIYGKGPTINPTTTTVQETTPGYSVCDPVTMSCPPPLATANTVCVCSATIPGKNGC